MTKQDTVRGSASQHLIEGFAMARKKSVGLWLTFVLLFCASPPAAAQGVSAPAPRKGPKSLGKYMGEKLSERQSPSTSSARLCYGPKKRIAVAGFDSKVPGLPSTAGDGFADMLITVLTQTDKFIVVERGELDAILGEQALGLTGAVKPGTEAKVGGLLGAQLLITGAITEFEQSSSSSNQGLSYRGLGLKTGKTRGYIACDLRILDATSGRIIESHRGEKEVVQNKTGVDLGGSLLGGFSFNSEVSRSMPIGEATRLLIDDRACPLFS